MAHVRVLPRARVWVLGGGWGLRLPWRLVLAGVMQVLWQPLEHSVCVPEPLGWTWRMPRGWSMLHCSLIDRCIDRCRNGLVCWGVSS